MLRWPYGRSTAPEFEFHIGSPGPEPEVDLDQAPTHRAMNLTKTLHMSRTESIDSAGVSLHPDYPMLITSAGEVVVERGKGYRYLFFERTGTLRESRARRINNQATARQYHQPFEALANSLTGILALS